MDSAAGAKRLGHAAARLTAMCGGIFLMVAAGFSYWIAGYADDAIEAGTGAAEDVLRSPESGLDEGTRDDAADWLHRLSDWAVSGRPDEFRTYCLVALAAGALAVVVALARRPDAIWPELAWGATGIAGLAPNIAFDLWFTVWLFSGSLIAAAAVIHYLARRDDHVRRAGAVARQAGTAASPHVGSALAAGSRAASAAVARARGGGAPPAGTRPAAELLRPAQRLSGATGCTRRRCPAARLVPRPAESGVAPLVGRARMDGPHLLAVATAPAATVRDDEFPEPYFPAPTTGVHAEDRTARDS